MKPWEDSKTIVLFRRMAGWRKIRMAMEMAGVQREFLAAGLRDRRPSMSRRLLDAQVASWLLDDST